MNGTAGWAFFKATVEKMARYKHLFSKSQKLRLTALQRKADKADITGDWSLMIDEAFAIWEV